MPEPTHALAVPAQTAIAPMDLLQQALSSGTSPEVIRELVALQQSVERFNWEREERQSKIDFDNALNECQRQIGRIAPNRERENQIMWLDYAGADKVVRPIYLEAGFSIGYSEVESPTEGRRMCATLSRGGVSKEYFSKLIPSGNSKMSTADQDASGSSRAMRYLLFKIFNIAVGIDKDEKLNKGQRLKQPSTRQLSRLSILGRLKLREKHTTWRRKTNLLPHEISALHNWKGESNANHKRNISPGTKYYFCAGNRRAQRRTGRTWLLLIGKCWLH
jgi:hypothetical protein